MFALIVCYGIGFMEHSLWPNIVQTLGLTTARLLLALGILEGLEASLQALRQWARRHLFARHTVQRMFSIPNRSSFIAKPVMMSGI